MKQIIVLLCLAALTFSQGKPACQICLKVSGCSSELLADPYVDPIHAAIIKQVYYADAPTSIQKSIIGNQINYAFAWPNQNYIAIVDTITKEFKVIVKNEASQIEDKQKNLGVRTEDPINASTVTEADIVSKIDSDIRKKYFSGEKVIKKSFQTVPGGYHTVYIKTDGTIVSFDVNVQNTNGNLLISTSVCSQNQNQNSNTVERSEVKRSDTGVSTSYAKSEVKSYTSESNSPQPYVVRNVAAPSTSVITLATTTDPIISKVVKIAQQTRPIIVSTASQVLKNNQQSIESTAASSIVSVGSSQVTTTTTTNSGQSTAQPIKQVKPILESQSTPTPQPLIGGYQLIDNPLSDAEVQSVLQFLVAKVGTILNSASIVSVSKQLVNGLNYKLIVTFDQTSTVQYEIVVYKTFKGDISLTSINIINAKSTYNFTTYLTAQQAFQLSYFSALQNAVSQKLGALFTPDTNLDQFYRDIPFFQLVYHNAAYKQIVIIVQFDILTGSLNIISQSTIPADQPKPEVKPEVKPPAPSTSTNQPNLSKDNGCEGLSQDAKNDQVIQDYLDYLIAADSRCTKQNLIDISWKTISHDVLIYRFKWNESIVKRYEVGLDYVQYTVNQWKNKRPVKRTARILNCLAQSGDICTKCEFKYYLDGGQCSPVQLECNEFDYSKNECQKCYRGYYLDINRVCQRANFLCESSDSKGNCLTCYKDYRLNFKGRCIYNADGTDETLPEQENNPLCSKFSKLSCLGCVQKCYQDKKGICKIPDPNCQNFHIESETCLVCMQKYVVSETSKNCVPAERYN